MEMGKIIKKMKTDSKVLLEDGRNINRRSKYEWFYEVASRDWDGRLTSTSNKNKCDSIRSSIVTTLDGQLPKNGRGLGDRSIGSSMFCRSTFSDSFCNSKVETKNK